MGVEDEKKKPKKTPAKKAVVAAPVGKTVEKKVKAVAKSSPARKKAADPVVNERAAESATVKEGPRQHRTPTHAEIAERAHRYFAERGYRHGDHEQDWYRAERELSAERS